MKATDWVKITTVQGQLNASILKSHLEAEGIPAILQYESLGSVIGVTVDGLGKVNLLVPSNLADDARAIITPREPDQIEE